MVWEEVRIMAEGTRLQLQFETMSGVKTWSFNYAKASPTLANVKALMQAMIANGEIYKTPPLVAYSAKTVTTSENEFDLS